jgi:hypothetical protein
VRLASETFLNSLESKFFNTLLDLDIYISGFALTNSSKDSVSVLK